MGGGRKRPPPTVAGAGVGGATDGRRVPGLGMATGGLGAAGAVLAPDGLFAPFGGDRVGASAGFGAGVRPLARPLEPSLRGGGGANDAAGGRGTTADGGLGAGDGLTVGAGAAGLVEGWRMIAGAGTGAERPEEPADAFVGGLEGRGLADGRTAGGALTVGREVVETCGRGGGLDETLGDGRVAAGGAEGATLGREAGGALALVREGGAACGRGAGVDGLAAGAGVEFREGPEAAGRAPPNEAGVEAGLSFPPPRTWAREDAGSAMIAATTTAVTAPARAARVSGERPRSRAGIERPFRTWDDVSEGIMAWTHKPAPGGAVRLSDLPP